VQQSQVDEALGNTFDRLVRAFMRQDPNVILLGEIRGPETARSTLRAALTGHRILSTAHANDIFGVVRRIMDLGVEESLLAQTLLDVLGQRLARRVCPGCTVPNEPPAERVREFFPQGLPAEAWLRRGRGRSAPLSALARIRYGAGHGRLLPDNRGQGRDRRRGSASR
jgi:type IV pilus assembly protein PilB